jgi:RNA polymerase sigma-70 factor (ECF subfamily)
MPEAITPSRDDVQVDEALILAAASRGDAAAIAHLYRRYIRPVYRYLYSRVGDSADAEDLTSQTFLSALESLPRYRHRGRFAAWLFAIARRRAADHFRRLRPQADLDQQALVADSPDPTGQLIQAQTWRDLGRRIAALTDEQQELLRLRYVADLSFAEIAAVLGKTEEAAKKSLYRLLATLQEKLEADGG